MQRPMCHYAWGSAASNTFTSAPMKAFVLKYLKRSAVSIDPFARNFQGATWRNDLNPDTLAEYHMDSLDFLSMLQEKNIKADLVIFDPPFSPRQLKECYQGIGRSFTQQDAQRAVSWAREKNMINNLLFPKGWFLQFGWNVVGMGAKRGFNKVEILIVDHGPCHNATLCLAEQKMSHQMEIF